MQLDTFKRGSVVMKIQRLLRNIDHLRLPGESHRDVESILVRQVTKELDRALPWQQGHGRRTATLATAIGTMAGLGRESLHHLKLASLLHDIGLLMVSRPFFKPFPWDDDAYVAMQCHPRIGAELLEPFHFLREASVLIAHHHERWDGTGYPYGIRGTFIPIGARVLAIADAFDAIEVPNVDSSAIRTRVAYRILRVAAGTQFDPDLIAVCGRCLEQTVSERHRPSSSSMMNSVSDLFSEELP